MPPYSGYKKSRIILDPLTQVLEAGFILIV